VELWELWELSWYCLYLKRWLREGGCGGSGSGWDESPAFLIGFVCLGWIASVCSGH